MYSAASSDQSRLSLEPLDASVWRVSRISCLCWEEIVSTYLRLSARLARASTAKRRRSWIVSGSAPSFAKINSSRMGTPVGKARYPKHGIKYWIKLRSSSKALSGLSEADLARLLERSAPARSFWALSRREFRSSSARSRANFGLDARVLSRGNTWARSLARRQRYSAFGLRKSFRNSSAEYDPPTSHPKPQTTAKAIATMSPGTRNNWMRNFPLGGATGVKPLTGS